MKKILSLALALSLILSLGIVAMAEKNPLNSIDWDVSKSKSATNLDENFDSNVTLSLPAADYKGDIDVVFVFDGSTSTDREDLAGAVVNLLENLKNYDNLNVKAGLVIFGGSKPILKSIELSSIPGEAENLHFEGLKKEMTDKSYDKIDGRSGSNLQALKKLVKC